MKEVEILIRKVKEATQSEEEFSFESVCRRLIQINRLRKQLEDVEATLKRSLPVNRLPYENEEGKIIYTEQDVLEQNFVEIRKILPRKVINRAAQIVKSRLSDEPTERKRLEALVNAHSYPTGEVRESIRVIQNVVRERDKKVGKLKVG